MKKLYWLSLTLLLATQKMYAQKKSKLLFEAGVEGGLTSDYLTVDDPGNNFERGRFLISGTGGPKVRAYLNKKIFIEAAFMFKENTFGFTFKQETGRSTTNGSKIFFIPIRMGYELKLSKKIALNAIAGVVPSFITLYSGGSGSGTINPGSISYREEMRKEYRKKYLTFQPGLSLSHLLLKKIKFSAGVNYYHGVGNVEISDVTYSINNGPSTNATISNRGSFINYNFGISYQFKK